MQQLSMNRKSFIGRPVKNGIDWRGIRIALLLTLSVVLLAVVIFSGGGQQ